MTHTRSGNLRTRPLEVATVVLDNGLAVHLVPNTEVPTISMNMSVHCGSRAEPDDAAGLSALVSRLLDEGTRTRTSLEIASAIESTGGTLDTDGTYERIVANLSILRSDIDIGLDLLSDIVLNPAFPPDVVDKERDRMLSDLKSAADRPQVVAGWAFSDLIYGEHPLHRPISGYAHTLPTITRDDVVGFHDRFFRPRNACLSIVGDFRVDDMVRQVQDRFLHWADRPVFPVRVSEPARQTGRRYRFTPMESEQVNLYLGHLGVRRNEPDFYGLQIIDTVLGGGAGFASRIPRRLRDEMGLAYTTFATITASAGLDPGRFQAYIATSVENTELAVSGLLDEIKRICEEPVPEDELEDAKAYLTGSFVFSFETSGQIARFLTHAHTHGLGFDFPQRYPGLINHVSSEDLRRIANRHFSYEDYSISLAGPSDAKLSSAMKDARLTEIRREQT